MSPYFRGILLGMALALIVAVLTGCGSADTPLALYDPPACAKPPHCPPDFVPSPQPVYPAN